MRVDAIYEKGIVVEFVYSPLFEMFCALHVLSNSQHHIHREKWVEKINNLMTESMKKDVIKFSLMTDEYLIIMDFCNDFKECSDLNIISAIDFLEDVPLYKINGVFKNYNKKITNIYYKELLRFLRNFYIEIFQNELKYIEPIIIRELKRKLTLGKDKGLFYLIDSIHSRIEVLEDEIVFYKFKEFRVKLVDLKYININVSTFISPHLLLGQGKNSINLTILIELSNNEDKCPKDLERKLKALGDATRLRILSEINPIGKSTQELSSILNISEAAVSKALKLLLEAKLVNKIRRGNYIIYSLNSIEIDYLPYNIYEYIN
ncbi:metalloregulator ArsR/SmtB family transcription factor [Clostridium tertium]